VASLVPGRHFDTDEYQRDVELTEAGVEAIEASLGCGNLHDARNLALLTGVNCALHARVLLKRDVDYIVRDGRVDIVDEFTGRVVRDRHWPDGLQAALEAKEGLESAGDGEILGTVTLQHFLRGYPRLCGMTGTARDAAAEVEEFYGLKTVVVPTHRPMVRVDHPDVLFTHREAKEKAVVEEVRRAHATGRPVLVGTLTVEESERLAGRLKAAGVECEVLNAKNDALEAGVVSRAGRLGAVTISTNMAGRGTDIRLGGPDETDHDQVAALGGLYVIGTNRHESRRVDLQLRGRAGRQGDPGESRFFVCLEDDLLVRYDIGSLIPARAWPAESNDPLDHPVIRREMARAQRIIEGQNLEIRRTLWRYSSAVEAQRVRTMTRRQAVLADASEADTWVQEPDRRAALVRAAGEAAVQRAEQAVTLFHLDRAWRDHLALIADVREGISLVALGGGDPLTRFSAEVGQAYERMEEALDEAILGEMDRVRITAEGVSLPGIDVTGPSSTWTYIVTDDPFRNQIGRMLTGPGRTSIAIYAAVVMMPLLLLWGIVDRLFGKQPRRRR
jgi:preprotein translocase subunit SecA